MAATLSGEATHYSEHHNPHGNRRERIEEMRVRLHEAQNSRNAHRTINSGGEPEPQPRTLHQDAQGRRRMFGVHQA